MDYTIIDAHAHLWLRQDTVVDGFPIRTLDNGRSLFMGEIRQMVPPFMMDGVNSAEVFLSNMDYAQVAAAVITQEFMVFRMNIWQKLFLVILIASLFAECVSSVSPGFWHRQKNSLQEVSKLLKFRLNACCLQRDG